MASRWFTGRSNASAARSAYFTPAVTAVHGLATGAAPLQGPVLAQFDPQVGLPAEQNRPAEVSGAHGAPRHWNGTIEQTLRFLDPLDPGVVEHFCGTAPCTADNDGE